MLPLFLMMAHFILIGTFKFESQLVWHWYCHFNNNSDYYYEFLFLPFAAISLPTHLFSAIDDHFALSVCVFVCFVKNIWLDSVL